LFVLSFTVLACLVPAYRLEAEEFRQQMHVSYGRNNGLGSDDIACVTSHGSNLFAATSVGLSAYIDGTWKSIHSSLSPILALTYSERRVWFVEGEQVRVLEPGGTAQSVAKLMPSTKAHCIAVLGDRVYIGTDRGLLEINNRELNEVEPVNRILVHGKAIRQIACYGREMAIAASGGLVKLDVDRNVATLETPIAGLVGWAPRDVRGVGYDVAGSLWFASPQGCGRRMATEWELWGLQDGVPWNDFTCIQTGPTPADVWFGTKKGAIRFDGEKWEYRQGKRWLLDDHIRSIAVSTDGHCWLATPAGLSCIENRRMTLEDKANKINEAIDKYHKRTEYGYVDAVALNSANDFSEWVQSDSDNDGLWTSMYGAAQCFEYAVTKSEISKQRAKNAFGAVAFLSEVTQGGTHTAPRGFPARTILPIAGRNPNLQDNPASDQMRQRSDPLWKSLNPRWPVSADGKWYWKTDTSSDELDGHYFFYALFYDLVASTEEEKRTARDVVDRVTTHLIENNYSLIDHDGRPTRWGQFGPDVLNTDRLTDCRGLNSLSILSYLLVASHVTGDSKYRHAYEKLLKEHNYFTNILAPKFQNGPGSGNQSDDEMAFMCYYNAFSYEQDPANRRQFHRSISRYFAQELPEACPLFNYVFARCVEARAESEIATRVKVLADAKETLRRFPLDQRQWTFENSHRLDIVPIGSHVFPSAGRGYLRSGYVIPIDERNINHWNQDPWRLDNAGSGRELADGTAFLLPYWMGVYHGFIER
jgi:hypothetical protein